MYYTDTHGYALAIIQIKIYKYTDIQIYRYADQQIYRSTDIQLYR